MPSLKLTKTAVETARPEARDYELRDTTLAGFICKVTPAGRKVFMLSYRTSTGERRKPSLGVFGALTVDQARKLAQEHIAAVRAGEDPSAERQALRGAPTVKELSERYMEEHCLVHNKASSARRNKYILKCHIVPKLGRLKVAEVKRPEIAEMISGMRKTPVAANHTLATLRKMFNLAEIWGWRPDGTNPCRHIQKFGGGKRTRLITDEEMVRLYAYLDRADAEGLEHPVLTLAIRLRFEFAARMSEILDLEWEWIDFGQSRVVWPDSKTGDMSKPISAEAMRLLKSAPRYLRSRFVIPSLFDGAKAMSKNTYQAAWRRVLERAGLPHFGTHAVRHRSATDIANSGVPIKVGMALTAPKTVTMFLRYVHTEDDPVRAAAETVAARRLRVVSGESISDQALAPTAPDAASRPGRKDRPATKTALDAYRPYEAARTKPERLRRSRLPTTPRRRRRSMSDCQNPDTRRPPVEIMRRAREVDDTGLIPFVDTEAAARYLAFSPHSLECYRSLCGGPPFYKVCKFVRYAVSDLESWAAERRHDRTAGENARVY